MSMVDIEMVFAFALFSIGIYGVTSGRDFLRLFFSLEMMLNAVILILALSSSRLGITEAVPLAYMIMVLATLEAAIGVLIFAAANRISGRLSPEEFVSEEAV